MCRRCESTGITILADLARSTPLPDQGRINERIAEDVAKANRHHAFLCLFGHAEAINAETIAEYERQQREYTPEYWRDWENEDAAIRLVFELHGVKSPSVRTTVMVTSLITEAIELREIARRAERGLPALTMYRPIMPDVTAGETGEVTLH